MTAEAIDAGIAVPRQTDGSRATRRPVILMTPDLIGESDLPTEREYIVRANYAEAIAEAGGIPLILPYDHDNLQVVLALADGIVITGARPGAEVLPERRDFERRLVEAVIETGKPLLGICHGMQLIGEHLGGEFVREMPDIAVPHMPHKTADRLAHDLIIETDGSLAPFGGEEAIRVNSLHRHALTGQGRFRVSARAPDGVIEAIEGKTPGFCLGVQWHPEYRLTALDRSILKAFVDRSGGKQAGEI